MRREVYQDYLVGLLNHPIRDRFPHLDSRDFQDLVMEAFQMLNVHRGQHIDAGLE